MEDHRSQLTNPEDLGIEMDVLEHKNCSSRQEGPFPGSARRLSTKGQKPNDEVDEHQQAVQNAPSIQVKSKEARHGIDATSGTFGLHINRSPGTNASGQCIEQEKWTKMFHRHISDAQGGGEVSQVSEAKANEGYFLERQEFQFKPGSKRVARQFHSTHGESTQVFHRDDLDSQFVRGGNKHGAETKTDESYFLAEYELQFKRLSEQDARLYLIRTDPDEAFVHSSKRKSNGVAKKHHTIKPGESNGVDGEYWRRMFMNRDDVISGESSIEQGVTEAQRQWYRPRKMRPESLRSSSSTNLEFWFMILASIMTIIGVVLIVLLWKYLLSI